MKLTPALFLDRDGVINKEIDYLYRISDFEFLDGVFECCKYFNSLGYKIVVITNQAGIARGYYTVEDFKLLTEWMRNQFKLNGVVVDGIYWCPHHPDGAIEEYRQSCGCRKPEPGMLLRAMDELQLDLGKSVLVGDKISDIQAGVNAGVGTNILVKTGKEFSSIDAQIADQIITNLTELLP